MPTPSRRDLANAIRFLAVDAVEAAKSGHPGMPMGMADIAEVLWNDFLRHSPNNPKWFNRDRFVLSNGHGSMLQYALLHLSGYDLPIEELKNFRQLHSRTAGHPEASETPGVETTTGPLGQGLANAVGFALAEKLLAQRFNRPEFKIIDHTTWVFLGDGCLMEGISHETCSLAGTWGLGKLVAFWDDNQISIDGNTAGWFTDDTAARFEAYGWQVIRNVDGHDPVEIAQAIRTAQAETARPSLICCRTVIGFGAPNKQGKESAHGAPLGKDEVAAARAQLDWPHAPFVIPQEISDGWRAGDSGLLREEEWNRLFESYAQGFPQLADELARRSRGELPEDFADVAAAYAAKLQADGPVVASRKASQMAIEAFAPHLPELIGGSADLAHSNLTLWTGSRSVTSQDANANYVYYGVREFGMSAISNGLALHGGFIPYDATFLVFSDYSRNALRMSALIPAHAIHVFTHDSIGLGEDGPTHQSVEHAASLRLIPNLDVWRPGDTAETAVAWTVALRNQNRPTALLLSRHNLPYASKDDLSDIDKGAYVLAEPKAAGLKKKAVAVIIATGSEVPLALQAQKLLAAQKIPVRVVSMPSTTTFDRQPVAYKKAVLPGKLPRIAVEMGSTDGWWKYGCAAVVGLDTFGESAPAPVLFKHFGFTPENVAATVRKVLSRK